MAQLNINITPEFEKILKDFMRARGIRTKSDAVRIAVAEGLQKAVGSAALSDFRTWLGLGKKVGENPNPRFSSDDDLWETS